MGLQEIQAQLGTVWYVSTIIWPKGWLSFQAAAQKALATKVGQVMWSTVQRYRGFSNKSPSLSEQSFVALNPTHDSVLGRSKFYVNYEFLPSTVQRHVIN